jgi:hypothetical protein
LLQCQEGAFVENRGAGDGDNVLGGEYGGEAFWSGVLHIVHAPGEAGEFSGSEQGSVQPLSPAPCQQNPLLDTSSGPSEQYALYERHASNLYEALLTSNQDDARDLSVHDTASAA